MKQHNEEIKIGISKTKSVFMILYALVIVSGSIWFWIKAIHITGFNRTFLIVMTSLLIIVFGMFLFIGLARLFDTKSGLILKKNGIFINFGPASGFFINWNEIKDLKINSTPQGPNFISIFVNNPHDYLAKSFGFKKLTMKMNNKSYGTPLNITTNWLKCNFHELFAEMIERIEKTLDNTRK